MMTSFRKMMKAFQRDSQSSDTSSGIGIYLHKETEYYKTYLVKIDGSFGFGVTAFREDDATLVSGGGVGAKVVFIAVDTTASMSSVIFDVGRQISTILRMSSNLLPVKIILALYADYEVYSSSNDILIRNVHFIHVCTEAEASKALLDYWNSQVYAAGGGDIPEMNLTLMATVIKYYRGIIDTTYDQVGFQVTGTGITCPGVAAGEVNCAVIQISDAVNRDPIAYPATYNTHEAGLERACLKKLFPSLTQWSNIDAWLRENSVPFIRIHLGLPYMLAMNRRDYRVGPQCSLTFASVRKEEVRLGSFLIALMTCLLDMTSLDIIGKYKDDFLLPVLEDEHQFPQEHIMKYGEDCRIMESVKMDSTAVVEEIWRKKTGHVPESSKGQVVIETLEMDDVKKEFYFNLCMEVCNSDYYTLMISNPVFAEVITAFKTVWSHKQVQDFNNSMSERCSMGSKEEIEAHRSWKESGKTMEVSVRMLINQLVITPMEEEAECEVVRLKDETARDKKSFVSDFTMQNPKNVEALFKFITALVVEKTTKSALKSELHQYTNTKDCGLPTFSPVIHQSDFPSEVVEEAESEQNEAFNLDALELRGVLRLYNSKLFLQDMSLISVAMMCVICARRGECRQSIGQMGEKYLASLRKRGVNWLEGQSNPAKIRPEACGALYSMVIRPFWELYADNEWRDVRNSLLTERCWKYMNTMVVMQFGVYNDVKVPVVEVKKTVECQRFSMLPSVLEVGDAVKERHFVECKACGRSTFRGSTLSNVCVSCRYNDHLVFRCKNAKKGDPDSVERANCIYESPVRGDFDGEMYCRKCLLPGDGAAEGGSKKQMVSFLVCQKCSHTYSFSGEKDLKRTPLCFVCTFVSSLRKKFKNGQDLESFLGDLSNPTDMVIQLGIASSCENGSSHLADRDSFWRWMNESLKARQMSPLKARSVDMMDQKYHRHFENTLRKLCGMSLVVGEQEQDKDHSQDVPQNPRGVGDVTMRLPQKEKKISKAKKRKEYKAYLKTLPHRERMQHIYRRREKRYKKSESIAEMKKRRKRSLQSSDYENLLRKIRDAFTNTCPKCKMSVVCSPEAKWEGCLVCDGVVDPQISSFFQQVQKPMSEVVPLDVLNSLVLAGVGVKVSAESWKDVKKFSSIGQFFGSLEILSSEGGVEKMDLVNDEHSVFEKVDFYGKPFNHSLIYNHCLMLKKGLEGRDLTSKGINEMKGACLVCGDSASYMYPLHKEGNCSGMICRYCATRNYWSMMKGTRSTPIQLSGWLSCMFCRQCCDNMHNLWIWIGAKHNITNAIEGITTEESTYFRNILNAMSKNTFAKLCQEFENSPDATYDICNKCLQLKRVPKDQVALPPPCGAPEQSKDNGLLKSEFECEGCEGSGRLIDAYPDNTVEAALLRQQLTTNANTGLAVISSKELMRPCPSCKHDIVKDGGCLAMDCPVQSCRANFCFVCGSVREDHFETYNHLRDCHNIDYMGSDDYEHPVLSLQLVKTASGNQHLFVFDTEKYYFDAEAKYLVEK